MIFDCRKQETKKKGNDVFCDYMSPNSFTNFFVLLPLRKYKTLFIVATTT